MVCECKTEDMVIYTFHEPFYIEACWVCDKTKMFKKEIIRVG